MIPSPATALASAVATTSSTRPRPSASRPAGTLLDRARAPRSGHRRRQPRSRRSWDPGRDLGARAGRRGSGPPVVTHHVTVFAGASRFSSPQSPALPDGSAREIARATRVGRVQLAPCSEPGDDYIVVRWLWPEARRRLRCLSLGLPSARRHVVLAGEAVPTGRLLRARKLAQAVVTPWILGQRR